VSATTRAEVDLRRLFARLSIALVWVVGGYYTFAIHIPYLLSEGLVGYDSQAYWRVGHTVGDIYASPPGSDAPYFYSPAFAAAVHPLSWLPFAAFGIVWAALELVVMLWLLKPGRLRWTVPLFVVAGLPELMLGNVYPFLALALVLSLSQVYRPMGPAATAFLLLTKITPGLPVLWFMVRREWAALYVAAATTGAAVFVSLVLGPARWFDWFGFLTSGTGPSLLWFPARAVAAVTLVVFAALRGRPALVPLAVLLTLPVVAGTSVLCLLAAVPRLQTAAARGSARGDRAHSRPSEKAASRSWRE
jgi:hypothetical protein